MIPSNGATPVSRSPVAVIVLGMLGGYAASALQVGAWVGIFGTGGVGPSLASSVGLWVGFLSATAYEARTRGLAVPNLVEFRSRPAFDVPVGIVAGVALQLAFVPALYWLITRVAGPLDVERAARDLTKEVVGAQWIAVVVIVGFGAPIVEEIFFRGLLRRLIGERLGMVAGILGSSTIFAATHFQLVQFPGLLLAGATFAVLAARTSCLGPAIACHIAFNVTTLVQLMSSR